MREMFSIAGKVTVVAGTGVALPIDGGFSAFSGV